MLNAQSMPQVVIVSPCLRGRIMATGKPRTVGSNILPARFVPVSSNNWPDAGAENDQVMLALHARRSADSITHGRQAAQQKPWRWF